MHLSALIYANAAEKPLSSNSDFRKWWFWGNFSGDRNEVRNITEPAPNPIEPQEVTPPVNSPTARITEPAPNPIEPQEVTPPVNSPPPARVISQPPSSPPPTVTQPEVNRPTPAEAVQNYYVNINQGEYESAWNQLAPNLQSNQRLHRDGYLSYIDW